MNYIKNFIMNIDQYYKVIINKLYINMTPLAIAYIPLILQIVKNICYLIFQFMNYILN